MATTIQTQSSSIQQPTWALKEKKNRRKHDLGRDEKTNSHDFFSAIINSIYRSVKPNVD
jgi:hypothetical protein